MIPTVAITGRPNVGKSTLFNRLLRHQKALVSRRPGMTRDVHEGKANLGDLVFRVLDTAGIDEGAVDALSVCMRTMVKSAVVEADVCLFVIDARSGLMPADKELAHILRRMGTPIVIVANKAESRAGDSGVLESWELGFGEPVAVSAEHGLGMQELYDALAPLLPMEQTEEVVSLAGPPPRIAVLGRPNVGKSTLINGFLGSERLLTGPKAGVTRDSIKVAFHQGEHEFSVADTAGMRRHVGARDADEQLAVGDALRSVRFCQIVLLMINAANGFEQQERRLARLVENEGRALVIAANKWDMVKNSERRLAALQEELGRLLPDFAGAPLIPVSALRRQGLDKLLEAVIQARDIWGRRILTGELNRWLAKEIEWHPPPVIRGRRIRLRYITQTSVCPPTFALFSSRPGELGDSYRRYLVNGLRRQFGFVGVPIRLMLRGADNPYKSRR